MNFFVFFKFCVKFKISWELLGKNDSFWMVLSLCQLHNVTPNIVQSNFLRKMLIGALEKDIQIAKKISTQHMKLQIKKDFPAYHLIFNESLFT